jgi:bla regulator protein BlaR1
MNHLWQSTLCVGLVWLLAVALRRNRAAVRYWLWLAASIKFLIPFSLLVSLGTQVGWRTAPASGQLLLPWVFDEIGRPFASPVPVTEASAPALTPIPAILWGVWFCGFIISVASWMRQWLRIRAVRHAAQPLPISLPIPALSTPMRLEPGVFGIYKPVLLLPDGIASRLSAPQLEAILAHELCHVRRQDNLTAAMHMLVQTVFWFHPLVWLIRARLIEERERACDEEVLRTGSDPETYAGAILRVCEFHLASPPACVAGVTGSDLNRRIAAIMGRRVGRAMNRGRELLLAGVAATIVADPIGVGMLTPRASQAQTQIQPTAPPFRPRFDVVTIKPGTPGARAESRPRDGVLRYRNMTLKILIGIAYRLNDFQIEGGPAWLATERFDIDAEAELVVHRPSFQRMLQALVEENFKVAFHRETRQLPIFDLVRVGKGPGLSQADNLNCPDLAEPPPPQSLDRPLVAPCGGSSMRPGQLAAQKAGMSLIADNLSRAVRRHVVDRTGMVGRYDARLTWTPDEAPIRHMPYVDPNGPSIYTAVEKQLGLKLEPNTGPVQMFLVDSAERPPDH